MNREQHLLTILAEECNEVAQRVSKALRFGISEVHPDTAINPDQLNNAKRIAQEMGDLIGAWEMLEHEGVVPKIDHAQIRAKKEKIERYLVYSKQVGELTDKVKWIILARP